MDIKVIFTVLIIPLIVDADYTTKVNPNINWGIWEGWGTSLAWWAKIFGERDDFADILFTTKYVPFSGLQIPGLGMNIVRYNAGACSWNSINGESMVESGNIYPFRQIEGFWIDWNDADPNSTSWNWNLDNSQRTMMAKAKSRGANIFELFSNSPMWWMLSNHNPSGADDGGNNLQSWNYQQFAVYLATIAKYAHDHWGIDFHSVEAFNEPSSNWWKSDNNQEGCHISSDIQQKVIEYLRPELDQRGLNHTFIAVSDENSYDLAITTWQSYSSASKSRVDQVNVHGYQGTGGRRDVLYNLVRNDQKALWNSEYGEGDASGMSLAINLALDMYWLHPTAWVYWQAFDGNGWGLIQVDLGSKGIGPVNTKFFVLAQYSRHIRPGMKILNSDKSDVTAAYDSVAQRLVIVAVNRATPQALTFDLSLFSGVGGANEGLVRRWLTNTVSGDRYVQHDDTYLIGKKFTSAFPANSVQTFEIDNVSV